MSINTSLSKKRVYMPYTYILFLLVSMNMT